MTSFLDFFQISIGALTRGKRHLVSVDASTTVQDAIIIFNEHRVSTLPVFETSIDSDSVCCFDGKRCVGMISMADIAVYIITFAKSFIMSEGDGKSIGECLKDPVRETIGYACESDVFLGITSEDENSPLSSVVERMCIGMHRCLIIGPSPRVLTQTDIVQYFLANVEVHPQISAGLAHTVASSKHGTTLVSVLEHSPVLHALEKLKTVSSVAVVNDIGQINGNLSASDLCHLTHSTDFNAMITMSVKEFLSMCQPDGQFPICTSLDATMLDCAKRMIDNHLHRVWTVSANDEIEDYATGCVSLTDVIRAVSDNSAVYVAGEYII